LEMSDGLDYETRISVGFLWVCNIAWSLPDYLYKLPIFFTTLLDSGFRRV
jgi:hypothetical protein